jgi:DNA-binding transcriptional MerR regulator
MTRIGDFSKLAHVSIKALHHYADKMFLVLAHVDRYTGYRHYTMDQPQHLNRILAYKELGFSLDVIAQLIDENLSIDEIIECFA